MLGLGRRNVLWIGVTPNPTALWLAHQITEAIPNGDVFTRRLHATDIRDRPIAPRSPWQNGYAERVSGSLRRECLDHVIVRNQAHLRRVLNAYTTY